jgi:hypothetical protein
VSSVIFQQKKHSHLFLECPFAKSCWNLIDIQIPDQASFPQVCLPFKDQLNSEFFMNAVVVMCWTIWNARNNLIFNGISPTIQASKAAFIKEITTTSLRVKQSRSEDFCAWIQSWL